MVFSIHSRINGTFNEAIGTKYAAGDSFTALNEDAMLFVLSTLLDYLVFSHELIFGELSVEAKDEVMMAYKAQAPYWGLPSERLPATYAQFERQYFDMIHSDYVTVTPEAREVADFLLRPLLWEAFLPVPNSSRILVGSPRLFVIFV